MFPGQQTFVFSCGREAHLDYLSEIISSKIWSNCQFKVSCITMPRVLQFLCHSYDKAIRREPHPWLVSASLQSSRFGNLLWLTWWKQWIQLMGREKETKEIIFQSRTKELFSESLLWSCIQWKVLCKTKLYGLQDKRKKIFKGIKYSFSYLLEQRLVPDFLSMKKTKKLIISMGFCFYSKKCHSLGNSFLMHALFYWY